MPDGVSAHRTDGHQRSASRPARLQLPVHKLEEPTRPGFPAVAGCELPTPQLLGFTVARACRLDCLDEARRPIDENDVRLHTRELRESACDGGLPRS
jgi:hypothetical protein